eukprot:1148104-Pelagomonas_calceolata.AAC.5
MELHEQFALHVGTGDPQLMMAFTADGQLDPELINERDKDWGISTSNKRRDRAHLKPSRPPSKEADQPWHTNMGTEVSRQHNRFT